MKHNILKQNQLLSTSNNFIYIGEITLKIIYNTKMNPTKSSKSFIEYYIRTVKIQV